jgi:hypothetical protein
MSGLYEIPRRDATKVAVVWVRFVPVSSTIRGQKEKKKEKEKQQQLALDEKW